MTRARLLAFVAFALLLAGCRLDVAVGTDANADGSGRVRVEVTADGELVKAAGSDATLADDLKQAGWTVVGPTPKPGGGASIVATKTFKDAAGARQTFKELGGPFKDLTLERSHNILRTTTKFKGTVDFTQGLDVFGDPALGKAVGGPNGGIDQRQIEAAVNGPIDKAFGITVAARLPGGMTSSNSPAEAGNGASWKLTLHDKATLDATSSTWNLTNIAGLLVGLLAAAGLGVIGFGYYRKRIAG